MFSRFVAVVFLAVLSPTAFAVTPLTCPTGQTRIFTVSSVMSVGGKKLASCSVGAVAYGEADAVSLCSPVVGVSPTCGGCSVKLTGASSARWSSAVVYTVQGAASNGVNYDVASFAVSCGAGPSCSVPEGQPLGFRMQTEADAGITSACVNHCSALYFLTINVVADGIGGGSSGGKWISTGQSCDATLPDSPGTGSPVVTDTDSDGNDQHGVMVLDEPDTVGDQLLGDDPDTPEDESDRVDGGDVLDDWEEDTVSPGCITTELGNWICLSQAPNQPDSGTPGEQAQPDAVVTYHGQGEDGSQTNTYNYYNSGTVAGSTNHGDGPGNEGDGGDHGHCDGDSCADGAFHPPDGTYRYTVHDGEIATARAAIAAKLSQIKDEASSMFGTTPSGDGELTCDEVATQLVGSISICPRDYQDNIAFLGTLILLGALILAAIIILV